MHDVAEQVVKRFHSTIIHTDNYITPNLYGNTINLRLDSLRCPWHDPKRRAWEEAANPIYPFGNLARIGSIIQAAGFSPYFARRLPNSRDSGVMTIKVINE